MENTKLLQKELKELPEYYLTEKALQEFLERKFITNDDLLSYWWDNYSFENTNFCRIDNYIDFFDVETQLEENIEDLNKRVKIMNQLKEKLKIEKENGFAFVKVYPDEEVDDIEQLEFIEENELLGEILYRLNSKELDKLYYHFLTIWLIQLNKEKLKEEQDLIEIQDDLYEQD